MSLKFSHFFKDSPVIAVVTLNLVIATLWGMSFLLEKAGVPYTSLVFGTFALVAPGLCLSLILEQLSEAKSRAVLFLQWVLILSFIVTPVAVFGISEILLQELPVRNILTPFIIWWILCLAAVVVISLVKHQPTILSQLSLTKVTRKELGYSIGGFLAILIFNFVLYPLLPEGDGYGYLVKWDQIRLDPTRLTSETRSLFLIFVHLVSTLLKVDPYWVLKAFLPLAHIMLILSSYMFVSRFTQNSHYRILFALSPLYFPVVLQEILISRPQSFFLIALLPLIVTVLEVFAAKEKNYRRVYWLFAVLGVGAIGAKIHPLFALVAIVGFISIIFFFRAEVIKRPVDSLMITFACLVLLYPVLVETRILSDSWHLIKLFYSSIRHSSFEWWFIDHYRNVDGNETGWPGLGAVFYYGYNLGLFFPLLLLWIVVRRKIGLFRPMLERKYWALLFLFLFFFFIAEVAPRFQIAFLPDRAWLFLSLLFSLVLSLSVTELERTNRRVTRFVTIVAFLSLAAGTGLTYLKQGWVTREEVVAAEFIRTQLPENAVVMGQGSGRVMVRYYGKRTFFPSPASVFYGSKENALEAYLKEQEAPYYQALAAIPQEKALLSYKLNEIAREVGNPNLTQAQLSQYFDTLHIFYKRRGVYSATTPDLEGTYPTLNRSIYLVYNQNKFSSLYGKRDWWRSSNFYGADLEQLNKKYPIIYSQNGIMIWEARK